MVRNRLTLLAILIVSVPALATETLDFEIGKSLFNRNWVSAPASTKADDGLGPLSDASSCAACHAGERRDEIMVIRLGNAEGNGDPVYGHQLQRRGSPGVAPEANVEIAWHAAGALRTASIHLTDLGYGNLAATTRYALRRPLRIAGIGLLARIPEAEILTRADPNDADGDGVSGRPAWIIGNDGKRVLGRFGWRASEPTLRAQTERAFFQDMGLSTTGNAESWGECTEVQPACRSAPQGASHEETEISDSMRDLVVAFLNEAPAPRVGSPNARGEQVFGAAGCAACHATPRLTEGRKVLAYTDLLLHDLGPGLNDGIKEGAAEPGEWRTPPLWGMAASLRAGGLLHDVRARNVEEAIEWHDGEAAKARAKMRALSDADKAALLAFVNGL